MNIRGWFEPRPINWKRTLSTFAIVGFLVLVGFVMGVYAVTGALPVLTGPNAAAFPGMTEPTLSEVQTTLRDMPNREYGEGYNCVDFAWAAMRELAWKGQPSAIIAVQFETGRNHALLYVPTTDQGWVFIDPQVGALVRPVVGGLYDGRRITAMKVLTMIWVPIDEFIQAPVFEEVIDE